MTALKEQWQQAREQRQAELQQRREQLMQQLADITQQRQEREIATATDLQNFVADLQSEVSQTRFQNQKDLADLQSEVLAMAADVQASLIEIRQDRQVWSTTLMDQLSADAEALRQTVNQFLSETAHIRREQAADLHAQLRSNRQAQVDDVAAFRQSLQTSLAALKVFRQQLSESVWGLMGTPVASATSTSYTAVSAKPQTVSVTKAPQGKTPREKAPTEKAKAEALAALKTPLTKAEQTIFDHLQESDGLKVIEIEQALLLQRLQTIDALRALQQRGLVIQKERRYYAA